MNVSNWTEPTWIAFFAMIGALGTGAIQLVTLYVNLKFKYESEDRAREVKSALAVNTAVTTSQAEQIKQAVADNTAVTEATHAVSEATHELVNGGMSAVLLVNKDNARDLAELSGSSVNIAKSVTADKAYEDHINPPK